MKNEIIISDYFSKEKDNNNNSNQNQNEENNNHINIESTEKNSIEKENIQETGDTQEDFSNDIKIIELEKEITTKKEIHKDIISEKKRANKLSQKLVEKTRRNEKMKFEEFFIKKRHYLIMSDGGKPVYSRYGDPIENNSIFATLSAMITKFTIFNSNDNDKEMLNVISNNKNKIAFLKKGQLIFIALSKKMIVHLYYFLN